MAITMSEPDLLKGLGQAEASEVLALGSRIRLESGAELFRLGADADRVFLIERGRIALTLPIQVGGREEDVLVEERLTGQTVGWSGLIPPHRFTLKATAPHETEVIALPREALLAYFAAHPAVGYAVTRNLAAVIGARLQVFQAMWLREMQRVVELRSS
jgi:CRP/FNR family transcriptional regulator, cyclic AMP receptor protein